MNETLAIEQPLGVEMGDPAREIRLGLIVAGAFFVLFLGWAALHAA